MRFQSCERGVSAFLVGDWAQWNILLILTCVCVVVLCTSNGRVCVDNQGT